MKLCVSGTTKTGQHRPSRQSRGQLQERAHRARFNQRARRSTLSFVVGWAHSFHLASCRRRPHPCRPCRRLRGRLPRGRGPAGECRSTLRCLARSHRQRAPFGSSSWPYRGLGFCQRQRARPSGREDAKEGEGRCWQFGGSVGSPDSPLFPPRVPPAFGSTADISSPSATLRIMRHIHAPCPPTRSHY